MSYRNRKLLDCAEGAPCMRCGSQDGTVVAAHSNLQEHGRGFAWKAHDCFCAFLCVRCHRFVDAGKAPREEKREAFTKAMHRTWLWLWQNEKIRVG